MSDRLNWVGSADRAFFLPWAPARDLEPADLARLVYRRTAGSRAETSDGLRPGDEGFDAALSGVVSDLLSSGLYASDPPPKARRPRSVTPEVEASAPPEAQEPEA